MLIFFRCGRRAAEFMDDFIPICRQDGDMFIGVREIDWAKMRDLSDNCREGLERDAFSDFVIMSNRKTIGECQDERFIKFRSDDFT